LNRRASAAASTRSICADRASAAAVARRASSTLRFATVHVPTPIPPAITPAATDAAAKRRQRFTDDDEPVTRRPGGACGVRETADRTEARSSDGGSTATLSDRRDTVSRSSSTSNEHDEHSRRCRSNAARSMSSTASSAKAPDREWISLTPSPLCSPGAGSGHLSSGS
jgi:hypothetical protein